MPKGVFTPMSRSDASGVRGSDYDFKDAERRGGKYVVVDRVRIGLLALVFIVVIWLPDRNIVQVQENSVCGSWTISKTAVHSVKRHISFATEGILDPNLLTTFFGRAAVPPYGTSIAHQQ